MRHHLASDQAAEIGLAVRTARGQGVAWKVLERVYARGERQLRRYADVTSSETVYNTCEMSGFSGCNGDGFEAETVASIAAGSPHHAENQPKRHLPPA